MNADPEYDISIIKKNLLLTCHMTNVHVRLINRMLFGFTFILCFNLVDLTLLIHKTTLTHFNR